MDWLELLRETERRVEVDRYGTPNGLPPDRMRLFAWSAVAEKVRELGTVLPEEKHSLFTGTLNRLLEKGNIREVPALREQVWRHAKDILEREYPHFQAVNALVEMDAALAVRSGRHFRMRPILLLGDPGLGKTRYARRLAGLLGLQSHVLSLATTSAGFVLSGIDSRWDSARPGLVFAQLMFAAQANPVFVVDEMDKGSGNWQHDPMGPLFDLLEPESSREFRDEFLPVPIDAGEITWICLANGAAGIPDAILSRLTVIEVPRPTRSQRERIAHGIYRSIREDRHWGRSLVAELPGPVAERIASQAETPRDMRVLLEDSCGRAAVRALRDGGRDAMLRLSPEDVPDGAGKSGFGFLPSRRESAPPARDADPRHSTGPRPSFGRPAK